MADLTITNTHVTGTKILAADVNTNNTDISTYVNDRNTGTAWDGFRVNASADLNELSGAPATLANAVRLYALTSNGKLQLKDGSGNVSLIPKILQIVEGTSTTLFSTTSATMQNTNLSVSITPTFTSSTILVFATSSGRNASSSTTNWIGSLSRGSTEIGNNAGIARHTDADAAVIIDFPCTMFKLDSPATTSATTYRARIRSDGGGTVTFGTAGTLQVIVAIEVAN